MDKEESTFQDILLELMVANETLDKIEKNTTSLLPLLSSATTAQRAGTSVPAPGKDQPNIETCCEEILAQVKSAVAGISYLSNHAEDSNRILGQIRNTLLGMRQDAELDRLRKLETDREASRGTTTISSADSGTVRSNRRPLFVPGSNLGTLSRVALTALASPKAIAPFFKAFARTFVSQVLKSFNPKRMAIEFGGMVSKFSRAVQARVAPYLTKAVKPLERLASKTKALYRLKLTQPIDDLMKAFERLSSRARALYRLKVESTPVGEFAKGLRKTFSGFSKEYLKTTWKNLKGVLRQPLDPELLKGIRKTFGMITEPITGFFERLASKSRALVRLFSARSGLGEYLKEIRLAWQEVTMTFRGIGRTFNSIKKGTGFIARTAQTLSEAVDFTARMGRRFAKFGAAIGKFFGLLGRVLPILDLFIAGFTFISKWRETSGNWIAKLEAAGDAALDSLVGWVYDLPKTIIGWIVGQFNEDLGKAIRETSFKDTIIPGLKAMWESIIEAMLDLLPKSISMWLRGVDSKAGAEVNAERKVKMKDPVVLENGSRTLADPNVPIGTKQQTLQLLTQKYGFTKQEVSDAVQAKLGKPLKDQNKPQIATETPTQIPATEPASSLTAPQIPATGPASSFGKAPQIPGLETTSSFETWPGKPSSEMITVDRIVNLQNDMATANKTGASMAAYEKDTADLKAAAISAPAMIPIPQVSAPAQSSSTVNSVTVNNTNLPDRTQFLMTPAFAY